MDLERLELLMKKPHKLGWSIYRDTIMALAKSMTNLGANIALRSIGDHLEITRPWIHRRILGHLRVVVSAELMTAGTTILHWLLDMPNLCSNYGLGKGNETVAQLDERLRLCGCLRRSQIVAYSKPEWRTSFELLCGHLRLLANALRWRKPIHWELPDQPPPGAWSAT